MKAEKNSFILYYDFREQTKRLSDEQLGRYMRGILDYEIDGIYPEFEDPILDISFDYLRPTLDNNKAKYAAKCEKNTENGKKGGRPPISKDGIIIPQAGKGFGDSN